MFCPPPPKSYVEALTTNETVLGGGPLEIIKFRLSHAGEALRMGLVPLEEEEEIQELLLSPGEQRRGLVSMKQDGSQ